MKEPDPDCVGFNLGTQKLHCLIVLDDSIAKALSHKAGDAFYRAFVVEDRKTGDVLLNQRFRYDDGDSWGRITLSADKQVLSRDERVKYLVDGVAGVMRTAASIMAEAKAPEEIVTCHYPPEPDDGERTFEWLIAQDLIEVKAVTSPDGVTTRVSEAPDQVM